MKKFILLLMSMAGFILFIGLDKNEALESNNTNVIETTEKIGEQQENVVERTFEKQHILKVEENSSSGYQTIKMIEDMQEIQTLGEILENAGWREIDVQMTRPPDYRFIANSYFYAFWVTPKGDQLEITIEGESRYVKLHEEESSILYEILTDSQLDRD